MSIVLKQRISEIEERMALMEGKINLLSNDPPTVAGVPDPVPVPAPKHKSKKSKPRASL